MRFKALLDDLVAVPEFAIGLGCAIEHADQLTYTSGLDLTDPSVATPIGADCRVCDRVGCVQRAFPHAGRQIVVSEDLLGASPYGQASLPGGDR